jgi:uncharacterized protein (DUF2062 family)
MAAAFVLMWVLHAGDHNTVLVVVVGVGTYSGLMGAWFWTATRLAQRRSERQRQNLAADLAERNRRLYGR